MPILTPSIFNILGCVREWEVEGENVNFIFHFRSDKLNKWATDDGINIFLVSLHSFQPSNVENSTKKKIKTGKGYSLA